MLRSWSNTLVSVRQVTQRNTGRRTAGIDGLVALTSRARAEMAVRVHASIGSQVPSPVRRVHVPKASGKSKMRPLGIPVLIDRCHQARVKNALEPEWEARFEPRSYGFRPGRGCQDAVQSLFNTLRGNFGRVWILDADLAGAFDKISHEKLLEAIGGFPARDMIAGWLKAGIFEAGKGFTPTGEGTPQGGSISPLLLNIALHGLEEAAGVRYRTGTHTGELKAGCPALTRYADDLVVCCHSRQQAEQVKARLAEWLEPRGLAFNDAKTRTVPLLRGSISSDSISAATRTASCSLSRAPRLLRGAVTGLRRNSAHFAGPTSQRYWRELSRSRGAGPPITGRWYRPGCSLP